MKFLVLFCAAFACATAKPLAGYAYTAPAPLAPINHYFPYSALPYGAAPAVVPYGAAPAVAPYAVVQPVTPVTFKTQYFAQDYAGQVSFGYSEPNSAQSVVQDASGNKVGSFSYINPEGKLVRTNYVADSAGYRVASNDLPQAPVEQPQPVQDTPEVAEARAKFFAEFEQAKNRERRAADNVQTPASTRLADTTSLASQIAPAFIHPIAAPIHPIAYTAPPTVPLAYTPAGAVPIAYSGVPAAPIPYSYNAYPPYNYVFPSLATH